MMAQYRRIKSELPPGTLLLFRLGDFYELFFEDAQEGASILNVALTRRGQIPMCGIPFHATGTYISKLLKSGRKVALCDQVEEARPGQLVKREVTQILSPGTHFDEKLLAAEKNNFLASVYCQGRQAGLAYTDLTTGEFKVTEIDREKGLITELERLRPAELLYPSGDKTLQGLAKERGIQDVACEDWIFLPETAEFALKDHFKVASLDGYGLKGRQASVGAAGALVHYLIQQLRRDLSAIRRLHFYQCSSFLVLDATTLRHLEILEPLHPDSPVHSSLFSALNKTMTPMGARRLRDWLSQPLSNTEGIHLRQEAVESLMKDAAILESLRLLLKEVRDLERTLGRLTTGSANPRDLQALNTGLKQISPIKSDIKHLMDEEEETRQTPMASMGSEMASTGFLLIDIASALSEQPQLTDLIETAIVDEPPMTFKEGGVIREGFNEELDELRKAAKSGKDWIAKLQIDEIEKTGIASLKVRYNSVFGYFIEITKSNLEKVPDHYIRKQTIANGERFITPELKDMEARILGAQEKSIRMEQECFQLVREKVLMRIAEIQETARKLAELDVLGTFAFLARLQGYCRPKMSDQGKIEIVDGRHPVVEITGVEERFVPNDSHLDLENQQIAIITGPNMAGKSTYIRQTALLTLMAHTGSFIPASQARIDLVDRIFTRIGASDDLSRGQSTFMVEMTETANILNSATSKSLVVLDEIGRGTSTFDGLSLAWSIVEFLHNQIGAKTLFATHYHELSELAGRMSRIVNYSVAVREWNDQIVFLHKIVDGSTDKSYGIQVARLAGVPKWVIDRSKEILRNLEEAELTPEGQSRPSRKHKAERERLKELTPPPQMDLFLDA